MAVMNKISMKVSKIYFLLVIIRIIVTILPQSGYIHPDEYFQSTEILIGDIFGVNASSVWEFNKEFPIRSVSVLYALYGIPLLILKQIMLLGFEVGTTPYLFVVLPRLICCGLSLLVDFSLYRICRLNKKDPNRYMILLSSSYVMWLYGTRTFSNTVEMVLFSVLLYLVCDSMVYAEKVSLSFMELEKAKQTATSDNEYIRKSLAQKRLPNVNLQYCILIAAILAIGLYNRPTFIAFAFSPIFFWLRRPMKSNFNLWILNSRICSLVLAVLPFVVVLTLIDSVYYGYIELEEVLNLQTSMVKNYVLTPFNFFLYNSNVTNISQHGLHPRYLHALVNIPLLFSVLGVAQIVFIIYSISRLYALPRSGLPKLQTTSTMLTFSFVIPLIALSIFQHQEPRFLIPLIIPIIILQADILYPTGAAVTERQSTVYVLRFLWWSCNILLFVFYSFFHQAGIYRLVTDLSEEYATSSQHNPLCVITSHTYTIPMSLIHVPKFHVQTEKNTNKIPAFVYSLGSSHSFDAIPTVIKAIEGYCRPKIPSLSANIYLVIPTILTGLLYESMVERNLSYVTNRIYYPHVSTEIIGVIYRNYKRNVMLSTRYDTISDLSEESVFDYLGLSLIKIE